MSTQLDEDCYFIPHSTKRLGPNTAQSQEQINFPDESVVLAEREGSGDKLRAQNFVALNSLYLITINCKMETIPTVILHSYYED